MRIQRRGRKMGKTKSKTKKKRKTNTIICESEDKPKKRDFDDFDVCNVYCKPS